MNGDEFASPDVCPHCIWAEEPLLEELDDNLAGPPESNEPPAHGIE
jgi:hypothetical protein